MTRYLLICFLAFAAACAQAGTGVTEIRGTEGPVTVFYPTAAEDQSVTYGPFELRVARNAAPVRGNGRLLIASHGSGGSPWTYADLARQMVQAGFVVAMP